MAGVRDPAFWRRFSMAVHMDEEKGMQRPGTIRTNTDRSDSSTSTLKMKHSDTWLERHRQKQKRAFCCGWVIVLITVLVLLGIVAACLWVFKVPPFDKLG